MIYQSIRDAALLGCALACFSSTGLHGGEFIIGDHEFRLPDGFDVELVAGPPLVDRPIMASLDDEGRLYVAESSGSRDSVQKQLETKPHRILRLEDSDGDGHFDRRVVFADRMMFPEGVLWHRGSVYVAAPPSIWKLSDLDGDGVCDRREEWFQGKTLTGCANDLHGPYLGPDGWIYWCKGAFAEQSYPRPDGAPFVTRAAHVFRRHPDREWIEPVMTGGMDNPVELAFTASGERIFTTTFFQYPAGGFRDGLVHAIYGGVYGKRHAVIDGHIRTGDLMPVLTHLGAAAPCGLMRYRSAVLGDDFRGNLFATLFNMQKVTRHILVERGSTFVTKDSDFLFSNNPDFHPTDILEDADGSLIVIDTGGWYKICCPTSHLYKPDSLGGIYRVRRSVAGKIQDPRGSRIEWSKLDAGATAEHLADGRIAVRDEAARRLERMGETAIPLLSNIRRSSPSEAARRTAVWISSRFSLAKARTIARDALHDKASSVRRAAAHVVALHRDVGARRALEHLLLGGSGHERRVAAEGLGRIGDRESVPALLAAASHPNDRVLEHSLIYALIEIGDFKATKEGCDATDARVRKVAWVATEQIDASQIDHSRLSLLLLDRDASLRREATRIISRHPEWSSAVSAVLGKELEKDESRLAAADLEALLAQLSSQVVIQKLVADSYLTASESKDQKRLRALRVMARSGLSRAPSAWVSVLCDALTRTEPEMISASLSAIRKLGVAAGDRVRLRKHLLDLASSKGRSSRQRVEALAALSGGMGRIEADTFQLLVDSMDPDESLTLRTDAAAVLSRAKLTDVQLLSLASSVEKLGALELSRVLPAFQGVSRADIGGRLLEALGRAPGREGLHSEIVATSFQKMPADIQSSALSLLARGKEDEARRREKLESLLARVGTGNIARGQKVFRSQKAACSTCHAIGYLGGSVGPDLTKIGQTRTERDLLEAMLYPSASFVRSYEPVVAITKRGQVVSGIQKETGSASISITTGPDAIVNLKLDDIAELRPADTSIMPGGLVELLGEQALLDLTAFLRATRR